MIRQLKNLQPQSFRFLTSDSKITKHKIFNEVFCILENRQIKLGGKRVNFIFHEKACRILMDIDGMTEKEIAALERSILRDAENMRDVEITIDAPAGLFYELKRTGETNSIYEITRRLRAEFHSQRFALRKARRRFLARRHSFLRRLRDGRKFYSSGY